LHLQKAIEDPEGAEAEAQEPPGSRSGRVVAGRVGNAVLPLSRSRRYCTVRTTLKATPHSTTTRTTIRSWWRSALWKLETMSELPVCSERPMPGIGYRTPLRGPEADAAHTAVDTTAVRLGFDIAPGC